MSLHMHHDLPDAMQGVITQDSPNLWFRHIKLLVQSQL